MNDEKSGERGRLARFFRRLAKKLPIVPREARDTAGGGHDLMTWVTVQSHDIGDTFLGIYALEKVFGVGSADAICSRAQEKERIVRFVVSSFWNQSQERLQMWQRYRAGGLKALGNASRRPRHRGKMHRSFWRMRLCKLRQEHPRWGAKKLRRLLKRAFPEARRVPAVSTLALWLVELLWRTNARGALDAVLYCR